MPKMIEAKFHQKLRVKLCSKCSHTMHKGYCGYIIDGIPPEDCYCDNKKAMR